MSNDSEREAERERQLQRLFAHAEPRPPPPADHTEEIRRTVLAEWEAVVGRRVFRRRSGLAAAAAVLLAGVLYVGVGLDRGTPGSPVASVERVQGTVTTGGNARLSIGSGLLPGTELVTGDGQLALRLVSGGSLRVAARSRVVLTSDTEAELVAGMLYFDSEGRRSRGEFVVVTEIGRVRDVGTQFFVQVDESQERLDVGVREGRVVLARDATSDEAGVGERLVATVDAGAVRRESVATFGADWEWAERLAPPFDTDGRRVSDFLEWFTAQTGRAVVFADPEAERMALDTVLTGSIDLAPMQKLSAVLEVTDLDFSLEGERVVIRRR